jgi:hypothetical protein
VSPSFSLTCERTLFFYLNGNGPILATLELGELQSKAEAPHLLTSCCSWCGLLTVAGYIALASIGHISTFSQCHGVFVFSHVFCALNSVFSASIFWTRCGALCHWNRYVVIPLAIYGFGISAFALASSADDFAFKPEDINSSVCIVSMKSMSQSVSRFLFASFDLMVAVVTFYALWYKSAAESWISRHLIRDQVSNFGIIAAIR